MSDRTICRLSFSAEQARAAFPGATELRILLAVLAGVRPRAEWEGCQLFLAEAAGEQVRVDVRGPGAGEVCQRLAEGLARAGIEALGADNGVGPIGANPVATVVDGTWV